METKVFNEFVKKVEEKDWTIYFPDEEDGERIEVFVTDRDFEYGSEDSFTTYYSPKIITDMFRIDIEEIFEDLDDILKIEIYSKSDDSINDVLVMKCE